MEILTYSVVIGTAKCNVRCPFCVATMTPHYENGADENASFNIENLIAGADLAVRGGATTMLLTGKGEPTLYPDQITDALIHLKGKFPIVELQTNGLALANDSLDQYLIQWRSLGLKTIAISVVSYDREKNKMMNPRHQPEMPDLGDLGEKLRKMRFTVRLSVVMVKGGIDTIPELKTMIEWCRDKGVHQLTLRPVTRPEDAEGKVSSWISQNCVSENLVREAIAFLGHHGELLLQLPHGALVYDVEGQNVCLTNCLTSDPSGRQIRQLIYCTDGHIRYDWRYEGAILF